MILSKRSWKMLRLYGPLGEEITGPDLFRGLHLAVDALENEAPGGATVDDIAHVADQIARCAEILFDARNWLRRAKGLPEIVAVEEDVG